MRIDHFKYLFKRLSGFYLKKNIVMFRKPVELWNEKTGESVTFKNVDECLDYVLDGEKVRDIILRSESLYIPPFEGGRGAGSGSQSTFSFNHASGDSPGGNSKQLLPAYANTKIKSKTFLGALKEFRSKHANSDHEWAYEVDSNGYVHQYVEGGKSSVGIGAGAKVRKGERTMIIHNHPSGGAFSDSDLISVSMQTRAKGIVASGKTHDYIFEKGTHFKASAFIKAVKTAKMKGTDYDDAADKWLRANQKKYGFKYTRNTHKATAETAKKTTTKKLTQKQINGMSRKQLESAAKKAYIKQNTARGLTKAEAERRFNDLVGANSTTYLRSYVKKYS